MNDTAHCLGYPSDSTRAARERAREATCGLPPASARVWSGAAGSGHNLSGYCILALASAAQLLARLARIATVVYIGVQWGGLGLARPGADRRQHRVPRGPGDRWIRPSLVREQLGRHRVADRRRRAAAPVSGTPGRARPVSWPGTAVDTLSAKLASNPSRPHWGPVMHDSGSCLQSRCQWAHRGRATNQPASGLLTTQPASGLLTTQPARGLLTIGRRRRRRAHSWTPPTRMLAARRPGGPGTPAPDFEVITVRVHSCHEPFPVRAESAHPTSADQRTQPPFPLNPATGVNHRFNQALELFNPACVRFRRCKSCRLLAPSSTTFPHPFQGISSGFPKISLFVRGHSL
jgi:hypothetical protein